MKKDVPSVKVNVCTSNLPGLGKAAARESQEANQVGAVVSLPGATGLDLIEYLLELGRFRQGQLLGFDSQPAHVPRRIMLAGQNALLQNRPNGPESVIEALRVNLF